MSRTPAGFQAGDLLALHCVADDPADFWLARVTASQVAAGVPYHSEQLPVQYCEWTEGTEATAKRSEYCVNGEQTDVHGGTVICMVRRPCPAEGATFRLTANEFNKVKLLAEDGDSDSDSDEAAAAPAADDVAAADDDAAADAAALELAMGTVLDGLDGGIDAEDNGEEEESESAEEEEQPVEAAASSEPPPKRKKATTIKKGGACAPKQRAQLPQLMPVQVIELKMNGKMKASEGEGGYAENQTHPVYNKNGICEEVKKIKEWVAQRWGGKKSVSLKLRMLSSEVESQKADSGAGKEYVLRTGPGKAIEVVMRKDKVQLYAVVREFGTWADPETDDVFTMKNDSAMLGLCFRGREAAENGRDKTDIEHLYVMGEEGVLNPPKPFDYGYGTEGKAVYKTYKDCIWVRQSVPESRSESKTHGSEGFFISAKNPAGERAGSEEHEIEVRYPLGAMTIGKKERRKPYNGDLSTIPKIKRAKDFPKVRNHKAQDYVRRSDSCPALEMMVRAAVAEGKNPKTAKVPKAVNLMDDGIFVNEYHPTGNEMHQSEDFWLASTIQSLLGNEYLSLRTRLIESAEEYEETSKTLAAEGKMEYNRNLNGEAEEALEGGRWKKHENMVSKTKLWCGCPGNKYGTQECVGQRGNVTKQTKDVKKAKVRLTDREKRCKKMKSNLNGFKMQKPDGPWCSRTATMDALTAGKAKHIIKWSDNPKELPEHAGAAPFYGHLPGTCVGDSWTSRNMASLLGQHRPHMAGIANMTWKDTQCPAASIAVSGSYEDDSDDEADEDKASPTSFWYTGVGGNDLLASSAQIGDQKMETGNVALKLSYETQLPVRVYKSAVPAKGAEGGMKIITYTGLYRVTDYKLEKGKSTFYVYRFHFERCKNQPDHSAKQIQFKGLGVDGIHTAKMEKAHAKKMDLVNKKADGSAGRGLKADAQAKSLRVPKRLAETTRGCITADYAQNNENVAIPVRNARLTSHPCSLHLSLSLLSVFADVTWLCCAQVFNDYNGEKPPTIRYLKKSVLVGDAKKFREDTATRLPICKRDEIWVAGVTEGGYKECPTITYQKADGFSDVDSSECSAYGLGHGKLIGARSAVYESPLTSEHPTAANNQQVTRGIRHNLEIYMTGPQRDGGSGWGVRCAEDIQAGEFVAEYVGEVLTEAEANEKGDKEGKDTAYYFDLKVTSLEDREGYEEAQAAEAGAAGAAVEAAGAAVEAAAAAEAAAAVEAAAAAEAAAEAAEADGAPESGEDEGAGSSSAGKKRCRKPRRQHNAAAPPSPSPAKRAKAASPGRKKSLQIAEGTDTFIVDSQDAGNLSRFFNHEPRTPNMFMQAVFCNGHRDPRMPSLAFFSQKFVPAYEQLTFDYGKDYNWANQEISRYD